MNFVNNERIFSIEFKSDCNEFKSLCKIYEIMNSKKGSVLKHS